MSIKSVETAGLSVGRKRVVNEIARNLARQGVRFRQADVLIIDPYTVRLGFKQNEASIKWMALARCVSEVTGQILWKEGSRVKKIFTKQFMVLRFHQRQIGLVDPNWVNSIQVEQLNNTVQISFFQ